MGKPNYRIKSYAVIIAGTLDWKPLNVADEHSPLDSG